MLFRQNKLSIKQSQQGYSHPDNTSYNESFPEELSFTFRNSKPVFYQPHFLSFIKVVIIPVSQKSPAFS